MNEFQETLQDLLNDLGIPSDAPLSLTGVLIHGESSYIRDLRMNLKAVLASEHLSSKETALLAYSVAVNNQAGLLCEAFAKRAEQEGAEPQEIAEMAAIASLLSANNVLYRYRHFVGKEVYDKKPARMRMNIMMRPVVGKRFFELASLVISSVNGCEMCVKSHEDSVLKAGATEDQIWDAVRLAGVITSLSKIIPDQGR